MTSIKSGPSVAIVVSLLSVVLMVLNICATFIKVGEANQTISNNRSLIDKLESEVKSKTSFANYDNLANSIEGQLKDIKTTIVNLSERKMDKEYANVLYSELGKKIDASSKNQDEMMKLLFVIQKDIATIQVEAARKK